MLLSVLLAGAGGYVVGFERGLGKGAAIVDGTSSAHPEMIAGVGSDVPAKVVPAPDIPLVVVSGVRGSTISFTVGTNPESDEQGSVDFTDDTVFIAILERVPEELGPGDIPFYEREISPEDLRPGDALSVELDDQSRLASRITWTGAFTYDKAGTGFVVLDAGGRWK